MKPDSCLTLQAVAERLGVSVKTVRRLIQDGAFLVLHAPWQPGKSTTLRALGSMR